MKEGFWDYYMNHEGYRNLGAPTGEEYPSGSYVKQDFQYGKLIWYGGNNIDILDLNDNPIPTQPTTFTPNPPTAEVWHNGEKQGEGTVTIALYEGFTYEYDIKEDGYDVGTQSITVPSSTSEVNPDLTPGTGANNPANFPLTIEAEDMYGVGIPVAGGVKLTSPDVPQHWYAIASLNLPQAGWIEAEVVAYAEGQVGGEWPKMLTGLQVRVSMLNYI